MPLKRGSSDKVVSENISTEMHSGRPQKQAIAIATSAAGRSRTKKRKVKRIKKGATRSPGGTAGMSLAQDAMY